MIDKSSPIPSGVRERDSEFGVVLRSFSFGEIYEILYALLEDVSSNQSASIIFANDLKRSIAIGGEIIGTTYFPISSSDRECCREIICEADAIESIVSSRAVFRTRDILESRKIARKESLFERKCRLFGFGLIGIERSNKCIAHRL